MILNNCRLIPALSSGTGTSLGSVEIEDGNILAVYETPVSDSEADYDCKGKTLLPGLIDLHTHITLLGGIGTDCLEEPMKLLLVAQEQARKYLDYGFTTIRDCCSLQQAAHFVRDAIAKGLIVGPDILSCGKIVTSSAMGSKKKENTDSVSFADGSDQIRRAVREEATKNPDFIKIYASGSALLPTGAPQYPIMTSDEIRTAVETAAMNGLYVAAHCHADKAIRTCAENGVKTIEHATYMSESTLDVILDTPDCYLVPTFSAMYVTQTKPKEREFWLKRLGPMLDNCAGIIEKAYREGEKLGFGTDCIPESFQYEHGIEFQMRKEKCHMENVDILLQATKYNAEIAGIQHLTGEIRKGLHADLILVDGNPDEDLSAMYQKPLQVWKKGRMMKNEAAQ